ncbi:MAG: DNA-binding response regulator [Stygiobacter sp. RIFOXYC12_FULL_38_8]|nr:MAG: DNA-binding response regulator [Stygiobacter sp. GWC2_38_9]OGV06585.1 MAG: DNA-binding response regulator [Stygiobacter sp. RIFOXYB2_FULL_37_11]OGV13153.1 MAG: DNA-binding response regulator [Stygiobacter sp. RIFOXYC2_FULL_38_25]OGV17019.1 MAG: DNA-binding response regulator [Stygiobacter sp. RIFOXYA2_FULL_38_8]OGV29148.1 MAG: DNA-binding response regulator [Stygiobacter sp. RIFOXYC12_FULL_38_8]OGV83199.1 MAG: DNA-binding response regulator [Stygiobacter sp. GWF2_38_21]RJQ58680.1 MAG:
MVKISIIEDNVFARTAWATALSSEEDFVVLESFGSCEEAIESEVIKKSDVILLDIGLPGISGIKGAEILSSINNNALIIMITIQDDDKSIFGSLQAGAIGYLHKSVSPEELIGAIRLALKGGSPMTPQIARKVLKSFHKFKPKYTEDKLTDKETTILNLLSEGKSYKKISEEIFLSVDGVKYHIRSIYEKLHVHSRAEAVNKGQKLRILTKW